MQQIARKSEILAPKSQQMARESEILAPKCSKWQGKLPQTAEHKQILNNTKKIQ